MWYNIGSQGRLSVLLCSRTRRGESAARDGGKRYAICYAVTKESCAVLYGGSILFTYLTICIFVLLSGECFCKDERVGDCDSDQYQLEKYILFCDQF